MLCPLLPVWCVYGPSTTLLRAVCPLSAQEKGLLVQIFPLPPRRTRMHKLPQMVESGVPISHHLNPRLHLNRLIPGIGSIGIGRGLMGAGRRRSTEGGGNPLVSNLLWGGRRGPLFSFPCRHRCLHVVYVRRALTTKTKETDSPKVIHSLV